VGASNKIPAKAVAKYGLPAKGTLIMMNASKKVSRPKIEKAIASAHGICDGGKLQIAGSLELERNKTEH
jgi:hypothetical protein